MRTRTGFIIRYYLNLVLFFIVQKPIFMLFTNDGQSLCFGDYIDVIAHAIPMDLSVAGYLTAVPLLAVLVGTWWPLQPNFNARKVLKIYNMFIGLLLSAIFVADISIYPFWQFKLDSLIFIYLSTPKEAAASVSATFLIARILAIIVIAAIIFKHLNHITPNTFNPSEEPLNRRVTTTAMTILLGGMIFLAIRGGVKESTMNVGRVYFSDNQYLNHSAVNPVFSLFSSMGKKTDFSNEYRFMDNAEAERIAGTLYGCGKERAAILTDTLLNEGKPNILVVLMESFGSTFTVHSEKHLGEVATPNFWKAAEDGIYFSNMYCNSYRTDRGTLSTFSGWPSFPKASLMKMPNIVRSLPGIATELGNAGYSTHFLYGGDINFTNTKGYLLSTGFRNLTADTDFTSEQRSSNKWGVNDEYTFGFLRNDIERLSGENGKNWFYGFLTLSSHEPFEVPFDKYDDKVYNSGAYTDDCLGRFMDGLRNSNIWDNLLVILIPDHNMLYNTDYTQPEYFRCPMIWTGGAVREKGRTIDVIMNQSDLAATLLGQLGLAADMFPFSRNVLSDCYTTPLAFCCYNNGFIVADATGETNFDLTSGKTVYRSGTAAPGSDPRFDSGYDPVTDRRADTGTEAENENRITTGKALLQTMYNRLAEMSASQDNDKSADGNDNANGGADEAAVAEPAGNSPTGTDERSEAILNGYKDGEQRNGELRTQEYRVRAEIQTIQEEARKNADEIVVGVATGGSETTLSVKRLNDGSKADFRFPGLERDKIGNWFEGDTVMVYLKSSEVQRIRIIGKAPRDMD